MAIHVGWDDPTTKTISRVDFEGTFDINAVFDAWQHEFVQIRTVGHRVYSLNLFNQTPALSGTGFSITKIRAFIAREPLPNLIFTVQVAEERLVRNFLKTIASTMSFEVHVVASLNDAYALINAHKAASRPPSISSS